MRNPHGCRVSHEAQPEPGGRVESPRPDTSKGVPWGDHNETESSPPDPRREEYGSEEGRDADERPEKHAQPDERSGRHGPDRMYDE